VDARVATSADAEAVSDLFALGFYDDPVWSWAFPDSERRLEQQRSLWAIYVNSAIPYGSVWVTAGYGAAALWIPPGVPDLNAEDEQRYEPLLRELIGAWADEVLGLTALFESNRPNEPHHYLGLLATHPEHRGRGEGMGLLAENLARIDAEGAAAYLESSNPDNDHRYARHGFARVGEFSGPGGEPVVARMWREPPA
jgi:GNAT superfamily N-acetyltransferase